MLGLDIRLLDFKPGLGRQAADLLVIKVGNFEELFMHMHSSNGNEQDRDTTARSGVFGTLEQSSLPVGNDWEAILNDITVEVKLLESCKLLLGSGRVKGCKLDALYIAPHIWKSSTSCSIELLGGLDLVVALWHAQDNRRDLPLIGIGCAELSICLYRLKLIVNVCRVCHQEQSRLVTSIFLLTTHAKNNTHMYSSIVELDPAKHIIDASMAEEHSFQAIDDRECDFETESTSDSSLNEFMRRFDRPSSAVTKDINIPHRSLEKTTTTSVQDMYRNVVATDNDISSANNPAGSITRSISRNNHSGKRLHKTRKSSRPSSGTAAVKHKTSSSSGVASSPTMYPPRLDPVHPTRVRVLLTAEETQNYHGTEIECFSNHEPSTNEHQQTIGEDCYDAIVLSRRMSIQPPIRSSNPRQLLYDNT